MDKKVEVKATYDKDSYRYHRYIVDEGQGIVGTIYIPKAENPICNEVLVKLQVLDLKMDLL